MDHACFSEGKQKFPATGSSHILFHLSGFGTVQNKHTWRWLVLMKECHVNLGIGFGTMNLGNLFGSVPIIQPLVVCARLWLFWRQTARKKTTSNLSKTELTDACSLSPLSINLGTDSALQYFSQSFRTHWGRKPGSGTGRTLAKRQLW